MLKVQETRTKDKVIRVKSELDKARGVREKLACKEATDAIKYSFFY